MSTTILSGLGEIAGRYDGFILDLWGVLHDGTKPFPGVVDGLTRLRAAGKRIVVLSNAPRRADLVAVRMTEIGIPPDLYDHVMTSGEEAWQHLSRRDEPFYAEMGRTCYHIGPPRDDNMLTGIGAEKVEDVADAAFILNTGPWGMENSVEAYEPLLRAGQARDLPMVCVNPDLVVMLKGRAMICAGALAQRYEELGGRVRWHGKPLSTIYDTCFGLLGVKDRSRILAVGDSLRTDIAGANGVGIDCVLIAGGIHAEEFGLAEGQLPDLAKLEAAISASGQRPNAVMTGFRW